MDVYEELILICLFSALVGELKAELEKQLSESEARGDQEKQSLAQELSRGKQAVINLMQVRKKGDLLYPLP